MLVDFGGSFDHVPIWDAMDGTFFDSGRLLWIMMMFQKNLFKFSSLSLVYGSCEHVPIWDGMDGQISLLLGTVQWS